ncbi:MAG: amino acid ABC transporter permease [Termitinemataceae bacterium]|nr:MAG: amino acid ABC transporter permease [Termitinemataceae bacterium]
MTDEWLNLIQITLDSWWPILRSGLKLTIPLTLISFAFGLVIAIITALLRISKIKLLQKIAGFYVWIFRGTPLLVQLFIIFFGLPSVGIMLDAFPSAIIAFSLNVGAYCSETIRSSILAINKGQWDAAFSIGMTKRRALLRIIAPQALSIALPPLSNSFISLVKDTSLAANITIAEMFMTAQRIAARTYEPMLLYCLVAVFYLLFSTVLSHAQTRMEKAFSKGR